MCVCEVFKPSFSSKPFFWLKQIGHKERASSQPSSDHPSAQSVRVSECQSVRVDGYLSLKAQTHALCLVVCWFVQL